ncbi:MAG: two component transcriptional regulator, LuxR family [Glaciihabitans sp.]|nr:two component transcriptional regulator, LuxR family [Glaciihabitans sp.]
MTPLPDTHNTVRVLIVDDEFLVRTGLRLIIEGHPDITIVAEAANGELALDAITEHHPNVVLMDIQMPVMDGLAATEQALRRRPELAIIVLTTFDTDDLVLSALQLGARGFLLKDTPPADLVSAIHRVAAGQIMLSPTVTQQLVTAVTQQPAPQRSIAARAALDDLSDRERDVAEAIANGLSNAEIAVRLFISLSTVKTHIARILQKLGADNRTQIAIRVHEAR